MSDLLHSTSEDILEILEDVREVVEKSKKPFYGYNPKIHAKTGGLNEKGRKKFKREQGSNLKKPVTEKNPTGERLKRKKAFCARMSKVPGPNYKYVDTDKDGKKEKLKTPKKAALDRWRCRKAYIKKAKELLGSEGYELYKSEICEAGKNWAKRKYKRWSAYAAMGASKYCKDPNYAKSKDYPKSVKELGCGEGLSREICETNTKKLNKGELKQWLREKWVRIGTDGKIKGECGTSKDQNNPDRCLPKNKAQSLSQAERAATAKKKKEKGKNNQFVPNTKRAKVKE